MYDEDDARRMHDDRRHLDTVGTMHTTHSESTQGDALGRMRLV